MASNHRNPNQEGTFKGKATGAAQWVVVTDDDIQVAALRWKNGPSQSHLIEELRWHKRFSLDGKFLLGCLRRCLENEASY